MTSQRDGRAGAATGQPPGAGQEVVAVVTSVEFDPYVIVTGPSGEQTENDDFGSSSPPAASDARTAG